LEAVSEVGRAQPTSSEAMTKKQGANRYHFMAILLFHQ
jgi:hypothetical protein